MRRINTSLALATVTGLHFIKQGAISSHIAVAIPIAVALGSDCSEPTDGEDDIVVCGSPLPSPSPPSFDNPPVTPPSNTNGGGAPPTPPKPTPQPCSPSGSANSPSWYAQQAESLGLIQGLINEHNFARGDSLDAQAKNGSTAYANYAFGVYNAALGLAFNVTMGLAELYALGFSTYPPGTTMAPFPYVNVPAANYNNINSGYKDESSGNLCTTPSQSNGIGHQAGGGNEE